MKFLVVGTLDADSLPARTHTHTTSYFSRSLHIPAFTRQCWVPGSTPWLIHWQRCTVYMYYILTNFATKTEHVCSCGLPHSNDIRRARQTFHRNLKLTLYLINSEILYLSSGIRYNVNTFWRSMQGTVPCVGCLQIF